MVVKITSPHSLQRALNYNEKKVEKGQAECIAAGNYLREPGQMKFHQKLERMQDLISLNERTKKTNTLHISLNFDPTEKHSREKLEAIAKSYIEKIGFGNQPYLVYQHNDAGHPHIHIVTTTIQSDGKRIDTYNIGRNQSEKARKEIETEYGLVKAQGKKAIPSLEIIPVDIQKAQYGKAETKRSITNVLDIVINQFKYTSLTELNAVLKQYNVVADRGSKDGRIYKTNGLLYKLLDEKGNKIGIPIKASSIYSRPTLKNLEKMFEENKIKREPDKKKLKTSVDWVLSKSPANLKDFIQALAKEKIQTVLSENKEGLIYGITFIDFRSKSVFKGSDLGKEYGVSGIQEKLGKSPKVEKHKQSGKAQVPEPTKQSVKPAIDDITSSIKKDHESLAEVITGYDKTFNRLPSELLKKKKKKRNQNL